MTMDEPATGHEATPRPEQDQRKDYSGFNSATVERKRKRAATTGSEDVELELPHEAFRHEGIEVGCAPPKI